ncbi:MAG: RNA methyltransferase [Bdellovibrionia bacterium]
MKRPFDVRVVLVRSLYDRNIGATSRAMSNMGFEKLILLAPKCEVTYEAQQAAATGQKALQQRVVYQSWEEFESQEPESIRIAFTARDGKGRNVQDLNLVFDHVRDVAPQFQKKSETPFTVHLIFGPEDWGLAGEDLEHSHFAACIPTYGENWSLNLAQAVLISLYDLRRSWGGQRTSLDGQQMPREKHSSSVMLPDETLKIWLTEMGFDLSKRRINVYTVLRRMLLQNTPTRKEITILETVLQQSIRKLREWKEFQRKNGN